MKNLIKFGNHKLPNTTAIFNLGSAVNCPSRKLGLCKHHKICYALKAERQYPAVLPYRLRQAEYWLNITAEQFTTDFLDAIKNKKIKITALRINEAGDFYSQECVDKLIKISDILNREGIKVYCYTARRDLDFSNPNTLHVMGSGFKVSGTFNVIKSIKEHDPKNKLCCGDCKICDLCQHYTGTIEVVAH